MRRISNLFILAVAMIVLLKVQAFGQTSEDNRQQIDVFLTNVIEITAEAPTPTIQWQAPDEVNSFTVTYANLETHEHKALSVIGKRTVTLTGLETGARYVISVSAGEAGITGTRQLIWRDQRPAVGREQPDLLEKTGSPSALVLNETLLSMDSNNFPFIFTTVAIDTNGIPVGGLTKNNFQAFENGRLQTDLFDVTPPTSGGGNRLADIIFVLDVTGSMGDEIAAVKTNMINFINALEVSDINYRIGFIVYADNNYVYNNRNLYSGSSQVISIINNIQLGEHGLGSGNRAPEDAFDALQQGTLMNFRPGANRVFILLTDAPSHYQNDFIDYPSQSDGAVTNLTLSTTVNLLKNLGITCYTIGPTSSTDMGGGLTFANYIAMYPKYGGQYTGSGSLTAETNGRFYAVTSNFNDIVEDIAANIGNTYIVRYRTDNQICDGQIRNVRIVVNAFGQSDAVTGVYTPCAAPEIRRTIATINLSNSAQISGVPLTIEATITDAAAPFVQSATCFYRLTGSAAYTALNMTRVSGDLYRAVIPGSAVRNPGVDYYITATDGQVTSSAPSVDPSINPYQIAVLPNTPPVITHTPVRTAPPNNQVLIKAQVIDNTNFISSVTLFYREFGTLLYQSVNMSNRGSGQFEAVIPAAEVVSPGVEYFIRAVDNFGLASAHGVHLIQVDTDCTPSTNYTDDFNDGLADGWLPNLSSRWRVRFVNGSNAYCLDTPNSTGDEWAMLTTATWDDFVLEIDAQSTSSASGKNYFIVFGSQSATDAVANSFYLQFGLNVVNLYRSAGGDGTLLATTPRDFVSDNQVHRVRIEHNSGQISVFADGQKLFNVTDNTLSAGYIGIGSFKSTACFDNLSVTSSSSGSTTFSDNFEDGTADGWTPETPSRWETTQNDGSWRYFLNTSNYDTPDGARLGEFTLIDNLRMDDFVFECDAKSWDAIITTRGADLCIVFGYQDDFNYYYVMYNSEPSLTAIHRVQAGVRTELAAYTQGTFTDGAYYPLRVERTGSTIRAFFNGSLIMTANDNVFGSGQIGIGSYNDSGYFDNIKITGSAGGGICNTNFVQLPKNITAPQGAIVSIPVIVTSSEDIGLAQFAVDYDRNVIQFVNATVGPDAPGFSISQVQTNPPFPPSTPGTNQNVVVQISGGGSNSFTGDSKSVVFLNFTAVGGFGSSSPVGFDLDCARTFLTTTDLRDLCGGDLTAENGDISIIVALSVKGRVHYYSENRPVGDASLALRGPVARTTPSDASGLFSFSNILSGNYTLQTTKSGDLRSALSGADALALLQAIAFVITLTPDQEIAGDVDRNGRITPADAVAVLRHLAFLTSGIGSTGQWLFDPAVANLAVSGPVMQDFKAFLLGDVSGDWGRTAPMAATSKQVALRFDSAYLQGDSLHIPLRVPDNAARVHSVIATFAWPVALKTAPQFIPAFHGVHFALNSNDPRKTHIAIASVEGIEAGRSIGEFVLPWPKHSEKHVGDVVHLAVNDRTLQSESITLLATDALPQQFDLQQNYPNPFNIHTVIRFAVPKLDAPTEVVLEIYSLNGQLVRRLVDGVVEPGYHSTTWNGRDEAGKIVSTGIYLYRLRAGQFSKSAKLILVK